MIAKYAVAALVLLAGVAGASGAWAAQASAGGKMGDKFIKEAIQGNLAEVQVGQLAQEKGASQGVKDFGGTLAADHQTANQSAMQTAQQMNVTPPDKPGVKQQAVYTKLSALSGDQFDRQFIKDMVKDHKKDIAKYQKEARGNGPAADYAKQILPKLREHLKIAEDLERGEHVASASQNSKMKTR